MPADMDMILTHIKQLCEIYTEYSDVICLVEVGMFGPWGEMGGSQHHTREEENLVVGTFLENTPDNVKIAVRTPSWMWSYIAGNNKLLSSQQIVNLLPVTQSKIGCPIAHAKRLCMFDDGYLGSGDDCGTYGRRSVDVEAVSYFTKNAYFGGEYATADANYLRAQTTVWYPENAIPEMYKLGLAYTNGGISGAGYKFSVYGINELVFKSKLKDLKYFNETYCPNFDMQLDNIIDTGTIGPNRFRVDGIMPSYNDITMTDKLLEWTQADVSAYIGQSYHKFINEHHGYRFVLRSSELSGSVNKGGLLQLQSSIENTGFANCNIKEVCTLALVNSNGEKCASVLLSGIDPSDWKSETVTDIKIECRLPANIEAGEYKAYLIINTATGAGVINEKAKVKFANYDIYDGEIGGNYLGTFSVTEDSDKYGTDEMVQVLTVFDDVAKTFWGYDYITDICTMGLMNGVSPTTFQPNTATSRAMLVQVLYNYAGKPDVKNEINPFKDVKEGLWYTDAIKWAYKNGVVSGISPTEFAPNVTITREQFATIMFRYSKEIDKTEPTFGADLSAYTDFDKTSSYAKDAMTWAIGNGYITGMTDTTVVPRGNATRAQMATIITRYVNR